MARLGAASETLVIALAEVDDDGVREASDRPGESNSGVWLRSSLRSTLSRVRDEGNGHRPTNGESPDESAALVARARGGDRQAFRLLFDRHRGDVARLVFRMVGPRAEIDDLVQEVFVQVHRSLRDFRGEARFSTWLHRVTVNVVLMHRRAEKSRPQLVGEAIEMTTIGDLSTPHPDVDVERRARIRAFFDALEHISEKKRIVFVLHDLEGMPPSEIAKVVDAPILTVRTRLFYARRELEEQMRASPILAPLVEVGGFAAASDEGAPRRARTSDAGGSR